MSPHLRAFRVLRCLSILIAFLFSRHAYAQSPNPDLTIRQGLPANNDFYEQFHYGHGTWLACVVQPDEFFTSKNGADWSRIPGPPIGDPASSVANAIQKPHYTYGAGRWVVVTDIRSRRSTIGIALSLSSVTALRCTAHLTGLPGHDIPSRRARHRKIFYKSPKVTGYWSSAPSASLPVNISPTAAPMARKVPGNKIPWRTGAR
jgi:hypothetical protein